MTSVSHISYYLLLQIFANEHEKIYLAHKIIMYKRQIQATFAIMEQNNRKCT